MDFSLEEEQSAIGELAAQVLGDFATHERLRSIEKGDGPRHDPEAWSAMATTGILGATVPEAFGGAGLDLVALGAALEEVGRTVAAVPLWETLGLAVPAIAEFAPKALAEELLAGVVDGSMILTAAWHERGGEVLEPGTIAERTDDGWAITGTKVCVPAALIAEGFLVPASIVDGSVGLFYVRREDDGVAVEPLETTLGDPQGVLMLAEVSAQLVSEGRESLRWAYERAVATQCAMFVGVCAEALRLTAQYSKDRKQFEVPIASFQAVAHRLADSFVDTEGVRLTARQALWRLSVGMEASKEVATAKYWAAQGGQRVVHAAAHVHGGVGVDRDYPLHRYFLAAKEIELQLGGSNHQLRDLGRLIAQTA